MLELNWTLPDCHSACLKILLPHSRFCQEFTRRISRIFRHASFQTLSFSISKCICVSRVRNHGFWGSWTFPLGPKIMEMKTFKIFGKWAWKVNSSLWNRMIMRSFWAIQGLKFQVKWTDRPRQTSNLIFSIEPRIANQPPNPSDPSPLNHVGNGSWNLRKWAPMRIPWEEIYSRNRLPEIIYALQCVWIRRLFFCFFYGNYSLKVVN